MARAKTGGGLADYRAKRDFKKTAEPSGKVGTRSGFSFVVQKHEATRLHYDFRLEMDGVLKSWAVTKGPSLDPKQKRLAVRTEDHPLDYGTFEGTIPKGEYGGGTVMLWDRGTWEPLHDPRAGLEEGMLHFLLAGDRLKGGWALIRMPPRGRETRENWLLIKERDEEADDADPLLETFMASVSTGRSMEEIAGGGSAVWHSNRAPKQAAAQEPPPKKARARKAAPRVGLPAFQAPQLATLVEAPPEGPEWLHEMKYDGYRCLLAADGPDVRCYSRNGLDWTAKFGPVAEAARSLDLSGTLIDGEVVAFAADGRTDFSTLQNALKEGGALAFFAFDLLQQNGRDIRGEPLTERKARLRELLGGLPEGSVIHFSEDVRGEGSAVLSNLCAAGHEGIVSKQADAPYRGERSRSWVKSKCKRRQEFVIGGWSASERRSGFRSLLVGTWREGKLVYAGRVGTGFDADDLQTLSAKFKGLETDDSSFESLPREVRRSHWIRPELVAEIAFAEFTADGILRHPSFLGLREDKAPADVRIETPAKAEDRAGDGAEMTRAGVRVSNPGKVLFRAQGLTKGNLVDYYEAVAGVMLPHLAERPLSLVRCPQGSGHKCFFQKHDSGGFPGELKRVMIVEGSGAEEQYFYITDLSGIVAGVQMGVLEFHIWGSRRRQVEKPDRVVFDLDPDEGLNFEDVRHAAFDLRDRLADLGLKTFPMLSGGKGFHVVAPLTAKVLWPDVKAFCRAFTIQLGGEDPSHYVAVMSKARRKGRIFVDYLRNERGSTAIAPYSTRSREGAPVAAPISWDEARTIKAANAFSVTTMPARMRDVGDPWPGYFDVKQSITKAMMKRVGME